ncbi:3-oxoadipate enol-lactonase [Bosea sp. 47.2.35]|jgi:3-oxoadipate enol-lactonase|uniref:3-oxoadipate enol-lactonase n=1 Tax=Bosea sp. 47.2.35 TaxID=2969304 RepID=UPI00214FD763|nr:3-oxoadipate enol-lactonase [Bosea sp. 47.2.35]MCR4524618.1 3-oxoadipate enol-lactonase [Bosea sp. 47.2.35]
MAFTRIGDTLVHWREIGPRDAPAVVLVNSLGTDFRIWDEVAAALSSAWHVITYDKRGHGLSEVAPGPYPIADFTDDLMGLADHIGLKRFALVGLSIGGLIGQDLAVRRPERLTALVLADTAPKIGTAESWSGRIEAVRKGGLAAIADPVMERWFTPAFHAERPDDRAGWRNALLCQPADGYIAACEALRDADLTEAIGSIKVPTLAIVGEGDQSTPPDLVRAMAERIPNARFALIEGCGHIPPVEQPGRLLALVASHLEKHGHG